MKYEPYNPWKSSMKKVFISDKTTPIDNFYHNPIFGDSGTEPIVIGISGDGSNTISKDERNYICNMQYCL